MVKKFIKHENSGWDFLETDGVSVLLKVSTKEDLRNLGFVNVNQDTRSCLTWKRTIIYPHLQS